MEVTRRLHRQLPPQQRSRGNPGTPQGTEGCHPGLHLTLKEIGGRRGESLWVPREAGLHRLEAMGKGVLLNPEKHPIGVELKSGVPDHTPEMRPP